MHLKHSPKRINWAWASVRTQNLGPFLQLGGGLPNFCTGPNTRSMVEYDIYSYLPFWERERERSTVQFVCLDWQWRSLDRSGSGKAPRPIKHTTTVHSEQNTGAKSSNGCTTHVAPGQYQDQKRKSGSTTIPLYSLLPEYRSSKHLKHIPEWMSF